MKKKRKQIGSRRNAVLLAVVLGVLLVFVGSIALAAPVPSATSQKRTVTMIDPFALSIVAIPDSPFVTKEAVSLAVSITPRDTVRVPARMPLRSEYQISW